ncbi:MAG TPA: chemotaxis protein [Cyanobacteria bacterium UBA8803]|nr:chemotaxis protein [Cyanobacteria bacterium UBA9273]HBL60737.1 chemotaxis protein [Cyanobacteria bacterium UBA8803]
MFLSSTTTNFAPLTLDEPLPLETRERVLCFPLGTEDTALLPLAQISEIIRVTIREILPVPEMPSCVLGICNWRGEMLWLIDLNHLVGGSSLLHQAQLTASVGVMVVQNSDRALGLAVPQVNDIELHDLQQLQAAAPGLFPPKLLPFILGTLPGSRNIVLDVKAITQCPLWQIHRGRTI